MHFAQALIDTMQQASVGYAAMFEHFGKEWPAHAPGRLLTGLSVLFGAPFWFDLLQRLIQLRGTGAKPGER